MIAAVGSRPDHADDNPFADVDPAAVGNLISEVVEITTRLNIISNDLNKKRKAWDERHRPMLIDECNARIRKRTTLLVAARTEQLSLHVRVDAILLLTGDIGVRLCELTNKVDGQLRFFEDEIALVLEPTRKILLSEPLRLEQL